MESDLALKEQLKTVETVKATLTDKQTEIDTVTQNNRK